MGIYNTYGEKELQLKVGELNLKHFNIGDKVDIPDGIYLEYGGIIVIKDRIFIAEYEHLTDKWGGIVSIDEFLDNNNPITHVIKKHLK